MTEIKFKRDTSFRKQFFVPDSFAHPAKMDAQLLIWCVEKYSKVGETILDPMAGSGTTMLACTLGRNCILVELEEKFCKMMRDNWEEVRMRPQLGYEMGWCEIIQGDARLLQDEELDNLVRFKQAGLVDKIVTSPPFGDTETKMKFDADFIKKWERKHRPTSKGVPTRMRIDGYPANPNNIGNLKSQSYLEAMLQVYQQCHKVLKPRGLMILVTKNFIRNKQVVRLDEDTIKLCEQAGFSFVERHNRKLSSQSFWRAIYHQKHPEVEQILNEDVLVLRK